MTIFKPKQRSHFDPGSPGYIGAGNRSIVWTRRSRPPFAKLKQIYGDHLENYKPNDERQNGEKVLSSSERQSIKANIKKEIRVVVIKNIIFLIVSIILSLALIYGLIWLFKFLLNTDIPR